MAIVGGESWRHGVQAADPAPACTGRTPVGKTVVTMPEASAIVYECPGCGKAVELGEDFVAAREYLPASDFSLHMKGHEETVRAIRRFHVEHFRGRKGDYVYELVHEEASR